MFSEQLSLHRFFLVSAGGANSPLKQADAQSLSEGRLATLRGCGGVDPLAYGFRTIRSARIYAIYMTDSARHFRAQFPDGELHLVISGDQLPLLHK